ncbi:MAG TPA: hypothetical protein C5S50_08895 [Methanosarcinaceae archaeon]|nr:hypothetical protein [Methanosarcinaceae archaeon]
MDRNELKTALREESSSSLKPLHPDFYVSVNDYIRELEDEIKKINNPRSAESKMLEDELQSALTDIEIIFIRRVRKITTRATSNAFSNRSAKSDMDKLLPPERNVYDAVSSTINIARDELIMPIIDPDFVHGVTSQKVPDAGMGTNTNINVSRDAEIDQGSERSGQDSKSPGQPDSHLPQESPEFTNDTGKSDIAKSNISEEYLVVRILKDLSTFQAVDDRKYTLQEHDIVSLPALNARGLVKRNIAQLIQDH